MNPAPLSATFIVRDRPEAIARAVASVRPYVAEVVIVDTGSTDGTPEVCRRLADVFEVHTGCNDLSGRIESFARARNHALRLARQPWAMWMDSDDELLGGAALVRVLEGLSGVSGPMALHFPYRDVSEPWMREAAAPVQWMRERVVHRPGEFQWNGDVHETLGLRKGCECGGGGGGSWGPGTSDPRPGDPGGGVPYMTVAHRYLEAPVMLHHKSKAARESGRNMRILRATLARRGHLTPREMFHLGQEHAGAGALPEAVMWLSRCAEASGWEDERAMAHMALSDLYMQRLDFRASLTHGLFAHDAKETWGEPLVKIARAHYAMASRHMDRESDRAEHVRKCGFFARRAIACEGMGVSPRTFFVDPRIVGVEARMHLSFAQYQQGDFPGAIRTIEEALARGPEDEVFALLTANRVRCAAKMPKVLV